MNYSRAREAGGVNHLLNLRQRYETLCGLTVRGGWALNEDRSTCEGCLSVLKLMPVLKREEPRHPLEDPYARGGRLEFAAKHRRQRWAHCRRRKS